MIGLLPGVALAAELYGGYPATISTQATRNRHIPVTLVGSGFVPGMTATFPMPDGPVELAVSVVNSGQAMVHLPTDLPAGRYSLRLRWPTPGGQTQCLPSGVELIAPRCTVPPISMPEPGALAEAHHDAIASGLRCLEESGAEELVALGVAGPGEGLSLPLSPVGRPPVGYNHEAARARAEQVAAYTRTLTTRPVTAIGLHRPLPALVPGEHSPHVLLVPGGHTGQGAVPCPVDASSQSLACIHEHEVAALVVAAPDGTDPWPEVVALSERYSAAALPVEAGYASSGPARQLLLAPPAPEPGEYSLDGCSPPQPLVMEYGNGGAPQWSWTALAGGGLHAQQRSAVTSEQSGAMEEVGWLDARAGLRDGPFVGAGLTVATPRVPYVMAGTQVPRRRGVPGYAWTGLGLGTGSALATLGVPILPLLQGRLLPTVELRGRIGLSPGAPWSAGLGLAVAWQQHHPLPWETR